jgi:hypothetical protein
LAAAKTSDTPIYVIGLGAILAKASELYGVQGPWTKINRKAANNQLMEIASLSGGRAYFPENTIDLSPTYDDIMENLRLRYVITYRLLQPDLNSPRTVRVELVNPKTGGPLEIVDANGRRIRAHVILQETYTPAATPVSDTRPGVGLVGQVFNSFKPTRRFAIGASWRGLQNPRAGCNPAPRSKLLRI